MKEKERSRYMKVNLHTHTVRCGHACGSDEEFVLAAIENGYEKLGFSDHTPFPYEPEFQAENTKMSMEMLEDYICSITALKEKYKGKIDILLGLECESVPRFFSLLRELRKRLDYMILGNHGDWTAGDPYSGQLTMPDQLEHYVEMAVEGMETGLFLYLAHPDLMFGGYPTFDAVAESFSRQLCREANRLRMPLEYNLYGTLKKAKPGTLGYPCRRFWEVAAEENVRAVVGIDAHRPANLETGDMDGTKEMLKAMGITVLDDPTNM